MQIRSILAVTDLSLQANLAIERAAQLAVEHRAILKLMVLPARVDAPPANGASRLTHAAKDLASRLGITVRTVEQTANTLADVAEEATCADLLVLGYRRERTLAALLRGQPAERLARLCRCPVLVTKTVPRHRYRRILVAVDFTPASKRLVKLAWVLDGDAEVELFHAISTLNEAKLRSAEASQQAIKAYRHECMRHARDRIFWLTDSFDARRNRVMTAIGHGDPALQAVVQQEHAGADLLMVGKRSNSPFADFIFGSVAQRVLGWASSDVLIVPDDAQTATRVAARQRIEAERSDGQRGFVSAAGRVS
ncbi:universal stress protein [Variovorax saccharolyticus]|uniref:universal stress protein n=1 Tax=Variovorax saccharolyticus TaxID=3053516 RepID=UPI0025769E58|nr:universal stress protein [Variovorax sp. J22R187]MDM0018322.1 universal stress protein [Variovorax sp. J22R187]